MLIIELLYQYMNKYELEAFPTFIDDLHVKLCDPIIGLSPNELTCKRYINPLGLNFR